MNVFLILFPLSSLIFELFRSKTGLTRPLLFVDFLACYFKRKFLIDPKIPLRKRCYFNAFLINLLVMPSDWDASTQTGWHPQLSFQNDQLIRGKFLWTRQKSAWILVNKFFDWDQPSEFVSNNQDVSRARFWTGRKVRTTRTRRKQTSTCSCETRCLQLRTSSQPSIKENSLTIRTAGVNKATSCPMGTH